MTQSKCKTCAAPIVWLTTVNGKAMPVNPESVPSFEGPAPVFDKKIHTSHYATCPQANLHRKRNSLPSAEVAI